MAYKKFIKTGDNGPRKRKFFKDACRWSGSESMAEAQLWWDAFHEVIVRNIFFNNECYLPGIGEFTTKKVRYGHNIKAITPEEIEIIFQPQKRFPIFEPSDEFINDVNCFGITKAYRNRNYDNRLNEYDIQRQLRVAILAAQKAGNFDLANQKAEELKEKQRKYNAVIRERYAQFLDADKELEEEEREEVKRISEQIGDAFKVVVDIDKEMNDVSVKDTEIWGDKAKPKKKRKGKKGAKYVIKKKKE